MSHKKKANEEEFDFAEVIKFTFFSAAVSILLVGAVLLLLSFLMSFYDVPQVVLAIAVLLLTVLLGFSCGYLCAKRVRKKGIFVGVICGVVLSVLILFVDLCAYGDFTVSVFTKLPVILVASSIGGVIGVNRKRKYR